MNDTYTQPKIGRPRVKENMQVRVDLEQLQQVRAIMAQWVNVEGLDERQIVRAALNVACGQFGAIYADFNAEFERCKADLKRRAIEFQLQWMDRILADPDKAREEMAKYRVAIRAEVERERASGGLKA